MKPINPLSQSALPFALPLILAVLAYSPTTHSLADGAPVQVAPVEKRSMQPTLQLTGSITSKQSARLSAATAGLVTEVAVDAGTAVKAGDTLVRLDWELAQWQTKIADAGLATTRLALEDAERRLREARTLAPQRSIAETVVRDLEAEVASDRAALERAKAEAGYRAGIRARHVLTAPFDGVVSAKLTEVGEWVTPGQPVLEIVAAGALRMEFPVTQEHRLALAVGNPIAYRLGNDDSERAAQLTTIVPIADPGARTFLIHAEPETDDSRMAPGMSVRGELAVGSGSKRLAVPRDAVLSFPDGRTVVWVIETSGESTTAKETVIEIDNYFNGRAAIRAGLSLGQRVIVKGNEALQNGQIVRVVKGVDR